MRKFTWLVLTNCDPAHEKEFNAWYDDVHLKDLLRIPGVVGAKRSRLAGAQMTMVEGGLKLCGPEDIGAKHRYLACYYIETDDIAAVLEEIRVRSGTPDLEISPHLTEAYTMMFEDIP